MAIPSDDPYVLMLWLGRRQAVNRILRFLSKPMNWVIVVAIAAYAVFGTVLPFVVFQRGGPSTLLLPSQVDLSAAGGFLAIALGYLAGLSVVFGGMQVTDPEPFLLAVFATPFERRVIVRYQTVRFCAYLGLMTLLVAGVGTLFVTGSVAVPFGPTWLRFWGVLFPIAMFWASLGLLLAARARRWLERRSSAILGSLTILALAIGAGTFVPNSPVVPAITKVVTEVAGPIVQWVVGSSLSRWGYLSIVVPWITAALAAAFVLGTDYPVPSALRMAEAGGGLGPEQTARAGWDARVRKALRFRYRDYGDGPDAVKGEVMTLALRSGEVFIGVIGLAVAAVFLLPDLGGLPSRAPEFVLFAVIGFGAWLGTYLLALMGASYRQLLTEQFRQLPLSGKAALDGWLAPRRWVIGFLSVSVGIAMGILEQDPLLGILGGSLMASLLYAVAVLIPWSAPFTRPPNAPAGETPTLPIVIPTVAAIALVAGESALGVLFPSPPTWDPLWVPFALSTALNSFVVWRIRPRVERRLVAPSRGA